MTSEQLRQTTEYRQAWQKITSYRKGFEFTLPVGAGFAPQANALKIIMRDAINAGLIEQIETELSLELEVVAERYKRI